MKKYLTRITSQPIFLGGLLMVVGSNLGNFFAYLYHLIFGRLLGPVGYGEFAAVIALIGIVSSVFTFFSTSLVKFASSKDKVRDPQVDGLIAYANKITFGVLTVFTLISPLLAKSLDMSIWPILFVGPNVFLLYLVGVYCALLQSDLKFGRIVIVNSGGWFIRLVLSMVIFYLGFGIGGIFFGYFLASLVSLLFLFRLVRIKTDIVPTKNFLKKFISYSFPVIVVLLASSSFITTDIVLVKKFFSSYDAGLYASIAALGKIIFYGAAPITAVIFPLVAKKSYDNKSTKNVFLAGFAGIMLISICILLVYFLFPEIVINIMFGSEYLGARNILGIFGMSSLAFSINYMFSYYFLSKDVRLPSLFMLLGSVSQAVGIACFHQSLNQVVYVSIFSSLGVLLLMVGYSIKRLINIRRMGNSRI